MKVDGNIGNCIKDVHELVMSSIPERSTRAGQQKSKKAERGEKNRERRRGRDGSDRPPEPKWTGLPLHEIMKRREWLMEFQETQAWQCPDDEHEIERKKMNILQELSNFNLNTLQCAEIAREVINRPNEDLKRTYTQESIEAQRSIKYLEAMNEEQQNLQNMIGELKNLKIQTDKQLVTDIWHAFTLWIFGSFLGLDTSGDRESDTTVSGLGRGRDLIRDLDKKTSLLIDNNHLKTELCTGIFPSFRTRSDVKKLFDFEGHYHFLNRLYAYVQSLRPMRRLTNEDDLKKMKMPETNRLDLVIELSIKSLEEDMRKNLKYEKEYKEWLEWDDNVKTRREARTREAEHRKQEQEARRRRNDEREDEDEIHTGPAAAKKEEKEPEYDDWENADVEPAKGSVFNAESDSEESVESEQHDHAVVSTSDAGYTNAQTGKRFDPNMEYIPDSTSHLKKWNGSPLNTFSIESLPRKPNGGVDWQNIQRATLCIMIQRMIAMFLYNIKKNKARKFKTKRYLESLQEVDRFLKYDRIFLQYQSNGGQV
jgi:hypothetical protein